MNAAEVNAIAASLVDDPTTAAQCVLMLVSGLDSLVVKAAFVGLYVCQR